MLITGLALMLVAVLLGILDGLGYAPGAALIVNALLAAGVVLMALRLLWVSAGRHRWHRLET